MIQEPLTIGLAEKKDGEEIYALYHSLLDDPYGTWNEEYPSLECVQNDLEENIVYAMRDATGRIVSRLWTSRIFTSLTALRRGMPT